MKRPGIIGNDFTMFGLMDTVKNSFRKALLVPALAIPLIFSRCQPDEPEPDPIVYPPGVEINYLSPISGDAPLTVHLTLTGTQGTNLVGKYVLYVDADSAVRSHPIDTTIVFSAGSHSVSGKVYDVKGLSRKTPVTTITANQKPNISATANLSVDTDYGYSPLTVHFRLSGTPGTNGPINTYLLYVKDKVISSSIPIDAAFTFYAAGSNTVIGNYGMQGQYFVYGAVVDSKNDTVKTSVREIGVRPVGGIWGLSYPAPEGAINFFETEKSTPQEIAYDALTTQAAKNIFVANGLASDITGKIYPPLVCNSSSKLFTLNSLNLGKDLYEDPESDRLIYDGYDGEDFVEIGIHGGTRKYFGTLGMPTGNVEIVDIKHDMNFVVTGDDLMNPDSYNFIEAAWPWVSSNVKAGGSNTYLPANADTIFLYKTFTYRDKEGRHENNYWKFRAIWAKTVNGELSIVAINPNIEIFRTRAEAKNYRK